MFIIVEGPDGAGKSTLVRRLKEEYQSKAPLWIMNNASRFQRTDLNGLAQFTNWIENRPESVDIMFDRFPMISENIYGPIVRGSNPIDYVSPSMIIETINRIAGPSGALVVYCRPPLDLIRLQAKNQEQMEGVNQHLSEIVTAYDKFMDLANFHCDGKSVSVLFHDHTIHSSTSCLALILKYFKRTL